MNISIPFPGLKTGSYLMKGALVHKPTGKTLVMWKEVLRKLPPEKGEVRFDENMVCLIDNEPFLPFGLFSDAYSSPTRVSEAVREAIELGCNALSCDYCNWRKHLDELHQSGLKIVICPQIQGSNVSVDRRILSKPLTAKQEESLRLNIRKLKDLAPHIAWYTGNEPQPGNVNIDTMKQIDSIISEEDPYHPTLIINHDIKYIEYYEPAMALIMPDPYPGFGKNGGCMRPLFVTHSAEEAVRASRGRKPVWLLLQAHNQLSRPRYGR